MAADGPVLVTGGTGIVGRALVVRLVADGRSVRALARSDEAARQLEALGAVPVRGDVLDERSLVEAMGGCDVVYHVAGINALCLKDPSVMHRVNVVGSANCVTAAASANVRRLVYTSSAATLGAPAGEVGREDTVHRGSFLSAYERSKFDAEQAVLALAEQDGVDVVCVNPSSVQGPGRASGTGQLLVRYLRGRLRYWVPTSISVVDIDDCASGHVLAEAHGERGRRYVLNGASLASDELLAVMTRVAPGIRPPRPVPRPVAVAAVALVAGTTRARRRTPVVCLESARVVLHGHRYDGSLATRQLGLQYRPVEETLRRTAEWLVEQGLVPVGALG